MIFKTLRVAVIAAAFAGSAVAAQAQNTTVTAPDTGGPIQKAGAPKDGAMMMHKKPKKKHHMKTVSSGAMPKSDPPVGRGAPNTGAPKTGM